MRKIMFYEGSGLEGSRVNEVVEVEDNATEEEIQEEFQDWLNSTGERGWYEIKDEECEL